MARLLGALRKAGADGQAAALVGQLAEADMFGLFLEQQVVRDRFRFGREVNVGYARCSTTSQDLTAQREQFTALGVPDRVYLDKGLTGTSRARPGLDQALAAVRDGDTFTVTKLDRLARSVPDALAILTQLSDRGVRFALSGSIYDWHDPMARMFLQILAVIAKFEAALIRQRTREGMTIARARGKLRGKPPSLTPVQDREIRRMHHSGDNPIAEIAAIFKVSRPTIYRALQRTTPGSANLPADTCPGLPSLDKYDQLLPSRQAAAAGLAGPLPGDRVRLADPPPSRGPSDGDAAGHGPAPGGQVSR